MAKNLANIRIYGGDASAVFVAPTGTAAPVDLAAPAVAYVELGWTSEDGIDFGRTPEVKKFKGHQGGAVVRTKIIGTENSFKFQCLEETAVVLGLMHAGSTGVTTLEVSNIHIPSVMTPDLRAWVIDEYDDEIQTRYTAEGQVGDRGNVVMKTDEMTVYEFTVDIVGDIEMVTDNPAVVYV